MRSFPQPPARVATARHAFITKKPQDRAAEDRRPLFFDPDGKPVTHIKPLLRLGSNSAQERRQTTLVSLPSTVSYAS